VTWSIEGGDEFGYENVFTDLFTLLKVDGAWKIMNKVFHLHP
jgi:hypothetical protein